MRSLIIIIGALAVIGAAAAVILLGTESKTASESAGPISREDLQNLTAADRAAAGCADPEAPGCRPSGDLTPMRPLDLPEPPADLPESMPRVDPDSRTGAIRLDVEPGPPDNEADCGEEPSTADFHHSPPAYPREALERKLEGDVVVEFDIDENGQVQNPRVVASTDPVFERAALRAVTRWRFRTDCDKDGNPVARENVRVTIQFRLEEDTDNETEEGPAAP